MDTRTTPMSDVLSLTYHAISEDWDAGFSVTPERLRRQLSALLEAGYVGATFTEAVTRPGGGKTLTVTFDDAYRSVIELASPVFRELGIPGTVFAPTAYVGSEQPLAWPGIDGWLGGPHEHELVPMSWEELAELAGQGWEIGSHTHTHPHLPELEAAALSEELERSRAECERRLGAACTSIAYPYGDWSPGVVAATRAAGYAAAGGVTGRVREPEALLWPRVGIYHGDGEARFRLKVSPAMRRFRASRAWRARFLLRRLRG